MSDLLFIAASPYQDGVLNLPVKDLDIAIPFYEDFMGFKSSNAQKILINGLSCGSRT